MKIKISTRFSIFLLGLVLAVVVGAVWFLLWSDTLPKDIRHILLISIDTCRADYLSCYGYPFKTTPNIDAVAQDGVLFKNAISPVPLTLPGHSSMLTGTIPSYHGVHDNDCYKLNQSNVTLAEILRQNGFVTGAIISTFILDSRFGLEQGFDTYNDDRFGETIGTPDIDERIGAEASYFAIEWLDKHKDEKFFLFLHYFDPHSGYTPPEPFASRYWENLYAGEIAYDDYCIGQVINKLKELGLYDSTLIIITSDHGEMRGEHGETTHAYFIYQSAIKVPLIIKLPRQRNHQNIEELVGLIDIVPTVCSLLDIKPPTHIQGKDLSAYFHGKQSSNRDRHLYCESLYATKYNANSLLGVTTNRFKYIQTTRPELYDLLKDPHELNNLIKQQPHRARILQDRLRRILEQTVSKGKSDSKIDLNEESRKKLESLGYVGGSVKEDFEFDQNKEDPKDLIDFHASFAKLFPLIALKRYAEAKAIGEKLLLERPQFLPTHFRMGQIAIRLNDLTGAVHHFTKALALDPQPLDAHNNLAMAFYRQGNIDQAIKHWTEALTLKPDWPDVLNNLAWVKAAYENEQFYDPAEAIVLARRACELTNYRAATMLDTLAVAYAADGNFPEAVKTAEKALELARSEGQSELAAQIQEHLKLFKSAKPYGQARQSESN